MIVVLYSIMTTWRTAEEPFFQSVLHITIDINNSQLPSPTKQFIEHKLQKYCILQSQPWAY